MHQQGEGICHKGLFWSQKHLTACKMMVKEVEAQAKRTSTRSGVGALTLQVSKK